MVKYQGNVYHESTNSSSYLDQVSAPFELGGVLVSTTISAFVKNIVESSGEGYAQFAHTLDIENIQGLILDNGDIAVAWTLLEPIGNHGARQFIYSCVIDPATGELKSDIHDLRDQYQHDFWIDVTFGLEKSGSNGYVVKYQGNVYHESTNSSSYLDQVSAPFELGGVVAGPYWHH